MKWIDRYYSRTRSPFAELTRHFFEGLLRPESAAGEDSFLTWLVQILAVLVAASWYIPVQLFRRYAELHAGGDEAAYRLAYWSDCLFALVTMALLVAVVTMLEWPALFPSRRDHLVLTPVPLTRLDLFSAKLAALFLFMSLFIGAITVLSGLALPAIAAGPLEPRPVWLRMFAMLLGATSFSYFVFLGLLALQGLLMMALPLRWFESVSFGVQVAILIALLCAFPLLPYFPARHLVAAPPPWFALFPPAWFWGLAEWIGGNRVDWIDTLAARAVVGFGVALVVAGTTYLFSYLQYSRYALETARQDRAPRWLRFPSGKGIAGFLLATLARGRQQKLVFLLIFGIGVALVLESSVYASLHPVRIAPRGAPEQLETTVVALPLTLSFFAMVAMRRVFRIPADLPANWIFRFTEQSELRRSQLDTVFRTFVLLNGLPLLLVCAPVQFAVFGAKAWAVLAAQALLVAALSEYLLQGWRSIPFTCAMNPARRHFMLSASIHLVELSVYSFLSANMIASGVHEPALLWKYGAVVLAAFLWFRYRRRRNWAELPLEFAESVMPEVEPLNLLPH